MSEKILSLFMTEAKGTQGAISVAKAFIISNAKVSLLIYLYKAD